MNRTRIALFGNRASAGQLHQRLVQAGLAAEVHDELHLERLWFVTKASAGARLEVQAAQSDRAEELLRAWDATEAALRDAVRCPECGSWRVDYPQFAHNSMVTNLALGLLTQLGLVEKEYYCEHCHYTWPRAGARPRPDRAHMAPNYFIEGAGQFPPQPLRQAQPPS
jgi:hypothetical protein